MLLFVVYHFLLMLSLVGDLFRSVFQKEKEHKYFERCFIANHVLMEASLLKPRSSLLVAQRPDEESYYLLRLGHEITIFEYEKRSLEDYLKNYPDLRNSNYKFVEGNLFTAKFPKKYDMVLSHYNLIFSDVEQQKAIVRRMKDLTANDGLNVISVGLQRNDESERSGSIHRPTSEELKRFYSDWNIVYYRGVTSIDSKGNEIHSAVAHMIARKI